MIKLICAHQQIDPVFKCATMDEAVNYLSQQTVLGVDTETEGKDFTRKRVVMFQIGTKDLQFVIDTRYTGIEPLIPILENPNIVKIFHNVKFDYKFLKRWWGADIKNVYDTMLAECVINCGRKAVGYSLNALTQRYLSKELNKDVRNKFVGLDGKPFTTEQILYGAEDVEHLIDIRDQQLVKVEQFGLAEVLKLENNVSLAFADIEFNGLHFDQEAWLANANDTEGVVHKMENDLDELVRALELNRFIKKSFQTDMFIPAEEIRKIDIKWSSPTQVLRVFREYGLDIEKVNAFELSKYKDRKFVDQYLKYKEKQKIVSTYGKSFLKYVMKDGKVRTSFWQILNTGRVSSGSKEDRKPNMQNIPADNKFRNCFKARPGYSLVSVDYSGQELGIIASGSKDPVWMKAREEEADLHSICADMVFQERWREADADEKKKLRTMIKTINFGLAYGMSKFKLSDTLQISVDDAEALINKYFTVFPKIGGFLENLGNYGKYYGNIRTFKPYRRIRWFEEWHKGLSPRKDFKLLGAIERASKNTPIQGTGADMIKLAMVKIRDYINDNDYPAYMVTQVHDEIGVEVKDEHAEEWAQIQSQLMRDAGAEIIPDFPMGVDHTISKKWCK
ncbi:MAG: putative DNA polymerase [Prokaryotic dsDNA virus sp.]|nr:MAG: putative DNA polymerase [Prokaryotic dsDNA virus sp.]